MKGKTPPRGAGSALSGRDRDIFRPLSEASAPDLQEFIWTAI